MNMPWTERYFETQYLFGVICCVLVLLFTVVYFAIKGIKFLVEKFKNRRNRDV